MLGLAESFCVKGVVMKGHRRTILCKTCHRNVVFNSTTDPSEVKADVYESNKVGWIFDPVCRRCTHKSSSNYHYIL